jgi:hypothetical protein
MFPDSLSLPAVFEYAGIQPADSVPFQSFELKNEPIAGRNKLDSWGFTLFLACFFIFVYIVNQKARILLSMASKLFRDKDRQSIFFETPENYFLNKFLLATQTIILLSIIVYCQAIHEQAFSPKSPAGMFTFIGITALMLVVFMLYKFLSYSFTGTVFFEKNAVLQWNNHFLSMICLSGNIMFVPTLILFYVEKAYVFCMYFFVFYLIFFLIIQFYKLYTLFFQEKSRLLYFILYLCTQEMIPLFLLYRGLVYLFITVQKGTLWIQM